MVDGAGTEVKPEIPALSTTSATEYNAFMDQWAPRAIAIIGDRRLGSIPSGHRVVVEPVQVLPIEGAGGNVYRPAGGRDDDEDSRKAKDDAPVLALKYEVIQRIARAANVRWDSRQTRRSDDGSNPKRAEFGAVCTRKALSGEIRIGTGTYILDLDAVFDSTVEAKRKQWYWKRGRGIVESFRRAAASDRGKDWSPDWVKRRLAELEKEVQPESDQEPWAAEQARLQVLEIRKAMLQRAESGAKRRGYLDVLGLKGGGYTVAELRDKVFLVCRLVADIDWAHDPVAHAALVGVESGLAELAYGAGVPLFGGQPRLPGGTTITQSLPAEVPPVDEAIVEPISEPVTDPDESIPEGFPTAPMVAPGEQFAALPVEQRRALVSHLLGVVSLSPEMRPKVLIDAMSEKGLAAWYASLHRVAGEQGKIGGRHE